MLLKINNYQISIWILENTSGLAVLLKQEPYLETLQILAIVAS